MPIRLWLTCVFSFALFSVPVFAQAKHPFTFEDMMKLKRVEEPVVSPDGKWVLFAAVDVDLKANTKTPHVWVVPLHQMQGPSTQQNGSQASRSSSLGMTEQEKNAEREIISDQDADRPRWAPDGKRFAFVSTKEEGSQVWIADFDGATGTVTAKHQLTNIPTEAAGELWSPDGKYILFKSDVYSECAGTAMEEAACNAKKVEERKDSKVKALIFTHLLYRHWDTYKEGKRTHLFVIEVQPGVIGAQLGGAVTETTILTRDLTPGDYGAPVFSLGGQDDYVFSPDGKELCYASNHDAMPAASTNNDLFTVPVEWPADSTSAQVIAATKDITAENKAADNTPLYSPDGKYIAYRAQQRPGYESDRWRLMLYDRKTGEKKDLTERFDRWIGSTVWSRDSRTIYFSSEDEGTSPIYRIGIPQPASAVRYVVDYYNDDVTITSDGRTLLFTRMSVQAPNEIYSANAMATGCIASTGSVQPGQPACIVEKGVPVTDMNGTVLSQVSMQPLDAFWFESSSPDTYFGKMVEGFLVKPPNFDPSKKYPVKFLIHGGPEGAWGDDWSYRWNPELFAANGYVVVMINFHGSTGYGQKFIDAINGDWGGAPFEDLMKGLDYAEQHSPFIDKDRECALGASYGGYMANWILGHTDRFKCIVTHDGMFDTESFWDTTEELWFPEWEFKGTPYTNREMYRKWSPMLFAQNFKTPTLVIHGQLDYRLDLSQGLALFTTLQRLGVPSKMLYFPDEGHFVLKPQNSQLWYKTVNDWVDLWVGKAVAGGQ
jgi:dipeptidyl aminopeptidase/acylaminoacyl peptidase